MDDEQFAADLDAVVQRAREAGVDAVVAVGTTAASSAACLELASRYTLVWAAVGIHPNSAGAAADDDWQRVVSLTGQPRVVALGETGLDRYWDFTPFDVQQNYFDRHLRLSQQCGLPLVVHTRDCESEMLDMLREAHLRGPLCGVMHSFSGTAEAAAECVQMGLFISFAGMLTYKKNDSLRQVAAQVPEDRLLVETDCPYLAPHPLRGKRNEPANVVHTAACLAEVRGMALAELAALTTANARRLFRFGR